MVSKFRNGISTNVPRVLLNTIMITINLSLRITAYKMALEYLGQT